MIPRLVRQFASGAAVTLGSTVISCALAIEIERRTHQLFFWYAPNWYARVETAHGLTQEQLDSVRPANYFQKLRAINHVISQEAQENTLWSDHESIMGLTSMQESPMNDPSLTLRNETEITTPAKVQTEDANEQVTATVIEGLSKRADEYSFVLPTQDRVWRQEIIACSMTG